MGVEVVVDIVGDIRLVEFIVFESVDLNCLVVGKDDLILVDYYMGLCE